VVASIHYTERQVGLSLVERLFRAAWAFAGGQGGFSDAE